MKYELWNSLLYREEHRWWYFRTPSPPSKGGRQAPLHQRILSLERWPLKTKWVSHRRFTCPTTSSVATEPSTIKTAIRVFFTTVAQFGPLKPVPTQLPFIVMIHRSHARQHKIRHNVECNLERVEREREDTGACSIPPVSGWGSGGVPPLVSSPPLPLPPPLSR